MSRESIWEKASSDLLLFLQKEVGIMRELLANMLQEEFILLNCDKEAWNRVMKERDGMVNSLGVLRENRLEASKRLQEIAIHHKMEFSLEKPLPSDDERSSEFISLCEQMALLLEKMNLQRSRNANLLKQWEARQNLPPGRVVPLAQQQFKPKISLATEEPPHQTDEENLGA